MVCFLHESWWRLVEMEVEESILFSYEYYVGQTSEHVLISFKEEVKSLVIDIVNVVTRVVWRASRVSRRSLWNKCRKVDGYIDHNIIWLKKHSSLTWKVVLGDNTYRHGKVNREVINGQLRWRLNYGDF